MRYPLAMNAPLQLTTLLFALLAGCGEQSLIDVSDSLIVDVAAGDGEVIGFAAVLAWEGDALPANHVGDALRLQVTSDQSDAALTLDVPTADPVNVSGFVGRPDQRNLHEVFEDCGAPRCELTVDIDVTRAQDRDEVLTLSGDAVYTTRRARWLRVGASMQLERTD